MTTYIIIAIIVAALLYFLRGSKSKENESQVNTNNEEHYLVELKIPGGVMPIERGEKYEDPLSEMLMKLGIGYCDGGGSELGPKGELTYSVIDVYLKDKRHVQELHKICKELNFPNNIEIKPIE